MPRGLATWAKLPGNPSRAFFLKRRDFVDQRREANGPAPGSPKGSWQLLSGAGSSFRVAQRGLATAFLWNSAGCNAGLSDAVSGDYRQLAAFQVGSRHGAGKGGANWSMAGASQPERRGHGQSLWRAAAASWRFGPRSSGNDSMERALVKAIKRL